MILDGLWSQCIFSPPCIRNSENRLRNHTTCVSLLIATHDIIHVCDSTAVVEVRLRFPRQTSGLGQNSTDFPAKSLCTTYVLRSLAVDTCDPQSLSCFFTFLHWVEVGLQFNSITSHPLLDRKQCVQACSVVFKSL